MKYNLQKAIERMHSNDMIKLATLFYDFRDTGITSKEVSKLTGICVNQVSSRRGNLEYVYGFKFTSVGKSFYLTDITLKRDHKYHTRQLKLQKIRKKQRIQKAKQRNRFDEIDNQFNRAFALMGA